MKQATRQALWAINRHFYARHAAAFSATRAAPWPGWKTVLALIDPLCAELRILDVGCGNGRFAGFLARQPGLEFRYLGVDASGPLLELARAGHQDHRVRFTAVDLAGPSDDPSSELPKGPHDLIVLFGVLHHIPGFDARLALLKQLLQRCRWLVCTIWQPDTTTPAFQRRLLDWQEAGVDIDGLEPGDHLLRWGRDGGRRYCHISDDRELLQLLSALGATPLHRFRADGRSGADNTYLVFHQPIE